MPTVHALATACFKHRHAALLAAVPLYSCAGTTCSSMTRGSSQNVAPAKGGGRWQVVSGGSGRAFCGPEPAPVPAQAAS